MVCSLEEGTRHPPFFDTTIPLLASKCSACHTLIPRLTSTVGTYTFYKILTTTPYIPKVIIHSKFSILSEKEEEKEEMSAVLLKKREKEKDRESKKLSHEPSHTKREKDDLHNIHILPFHKTHKFQGMEFDEYRLLRIALRLDNTGSQGTHFHSLPALVHTMIRVRDVSKSEDDTHLSDLRVLSGKDQTTFLNLLSPSWNLNSCG